MPISLVLFEVIHVELPHEALQISVAIVDWEHFAL